MTWHERAPMRTRRRGAQDGGHASRTSRVIGRLLCFGRVAGRLVGFDVARSPHASGAGSAGEAKHRVAPRMHVSDDDRTTRPARGRNARGMSPARMREAR